MLEVVLELLRGSALRRLEKVSWSVMQRTIEGLEPRQFQLPGETFEKLGCSSLV